jgi:hypothetical protein
MFENKPPRDARLIQWLQRINANYAPILRWIGLAGFLVGAGLGKPVLMSGFGGLIPVSLMIGTNKDKDK